MAGLREKLFGKTHQIHATRRSTCNRPSALILIGGGLGWLIGYLMARGKQAVTPANAALENELRQQLQQREGELTQLRSEVVSNKNFTSPPRRLIRRALRSCWPSKEVARARVDRNKEAQAKALADLREAFKALSADALKQTRRSFCGSLSSRSASFQSGQGRFGQAPESIKGVGRAAQANSWTRIKSASNRMKPPKRASWRGEETIETLATSNQSLAAETAQFRSVLKSNQARGALG